jgi:hypothetical protein
MDVFTASLLSGSSAGMPELIRACMSVRSHEPRNLPAASAGARAAARQRAQYAAVGARVHELARDALDARERAHKLMLQSAVRLGRVQARRYEREIHQLSHIGAESADLPLD